MPNTGSISGLTAETEYVLDAVHVDAWGNVSAVVSSAAFTTAAGATGLTYSLLPIQTGDTSGADFDSFEWTVDLSSASTGDRIIICYGCVNIASGATVNGNAATKVV